MIPARRRGEPLVVLAGVLMLWVALRIAFWLPEHAGALPAAGVAPAGLAARHVAAVAETAGRTLPATTRAFPQAVSARPWIARPGVASTGNGAWPLRGGAPSIARRCGSGLLDAGPACDRAPTLADRRAGGADGSRGLVAALPATADSPEPGAAAWVSARSGDAATGIGAMTAAAPPRPSVGRWSGDAWVLLRSGSAGGDHGAVLPAYGASQAGAVLRFRLDPGAAPPLDAYVRASTALAQAQAPAAAAREGDMALGLSLRPLRTVPVVLAVEARASRFDDGATHLRPAAMAITALPPQALPLGVTAEVYAAAGYVGGAAATGFADGQVHVDRPLLHFGGVAVRAGAGAWGGAERGASRIDIGPTASAEIALGRVTARLRVDWRLRVAGDAVPGSGPALTVSAGF